VTEEDFETTEGEAQDLYDKLMELGGWTPTVPETLRKRMTCLDSYWSIIVYMAVGVMNSCFDKFFKFVEIYFSKNWRPHTRCLYCEHLMLSGVNICQNMSICSRLPTCVKYVHVLPERECLESHLPVSWLHTDVPS
jgi:hypothetical protein